MGGLAYPGCSPLETYMKVLQPSEQNVNPLRLVRRMLSTVELISAVFSRKVAPVTKGSSQHLKGNVQ